MNEKVLHTLEYDKILTRLADYAGSPEAKELCLNLRPLTDLKEISGMQQTTADALTRIYRRGSISFAGIHNLHASLKRLEIGSSLNMKELLQISSLLEVCRRAKAYGGVSAGINDAAIGDRVGVAAGNKTGTAASGKTGAAAGSRKGDMAIRGNGRGQEPSFPAEDPGKTDSLSEFFEKLDPLTPLHEEIKRCILSEDEMADDASPELFRIRKSIRGMNDRIHAQLSKLMNENTTRSSLQDGLVTMRDGRYCLPVKAEAKASVPGLIHDQSSSGSTLFIEPMAVVNLNNELRELFIKEQEEIHRILVTLSDLAAACTHALDEDYQVLLQLDFIFARAMLAKEENAVAPVFNQEGRIRIRKGRHPLLDSKKVVPIDVEIGTNFHQLIVTGPNTGGKTVSLKTVGLLTLMGQSGLHIPAGDRSELAIFSEVFADIGDEQSIEQSLSTFSSHMTNIVRILEKADKDSLVLFDELCAGTDPTEGAALAIAILHRLSLYGTTVMATTHYSELKVYALTSDGVENACCEFNVETLSPTYRLLIGIPGKSNAFAISSKLGLEDTIIEDARTRIGQQETDFEDLIANLEQSRVTIEKEQLEIDRLKAEAEKLKGQLSAKQERLDQSKDRILREANEQALQIIQEAKTMADETIRNFRKYGQPTAPMSEMERERTKLRDAMTEKERKLAAEKKQQETFNPHVPKKLHIGDTVKVLSMNVKGTVQTLPNAKGKLYVQMGILRSEVDIKDLVLAAEDVTPTAAKRAGSSSGIKMNKSATVSTEIKLIGMTVDEALPKLDKYLDDAYLAHLPSVRIVHGKGTGALRKAVHNHLKSLSYIDEFHLGEFGEGDAGVTIATFK